MLNNISIAKVFLFFYVLIANNYTDSLFSKQLRSYIDENRYAKHMIGYVMMLLIIMAFGNVHKIENGIFYAIIAYTWFLLTTKLDIQFNIMIIALLLCAYIYESKLMEKEYSINNDPILNDDDKDTIIGNMSKYKIYMICCFIFITVSGTLLYMDKKDIQYGGGYNAFTYLFY